jgi:hypothetical protein
VVSPALSLTSAPEIVSLRKSTEQENITEKKIENKVFNKIFK